MDKEHNGITYSKVLLKKRYIVPVCGLGRLESFSSVSSVFSLCFGEQQHSPTWILAKTEWKGRIQYFWCLHQMKILTGSVYVAQLSEVWKDMLKTVSCSSRYSLHSLVCHWSDLLNPCASANFRSPSETWVRKWLKN